MARPPEYAAQQPETESLSKPIRDLIASSALVKQGAEGRAYQCQLLPSPLMTVSTSSASSETVAPIRLAPEPILLKHRFPKRYRHPALDAQLTRQRLVSEARSLARCLKAGVSVPALRLVDVRQGCLGMEWIDGWTVRELLGGGQDDEVDAVDAEPRTNLPVSAPPSALREAEDEILAAIGQEIARMHLADVIHGDLTTSNLMVRRQATSGSPLEPVIIDFGLSSSSPMHEDRAVDLYVLERAFASTHPVLPGAVPHFDRVLAGYRDTLQSARRGEWERTEKRFEEVRLRGRKRSMLG
ncbi:hypothetical protein JCM10908_003306 [Rhodotorula pacifica]|uniref:serine/threonine protein kinase BUD32 n=1 Tax=Rhodotorula pacifica TaxID=1495444 RepID=UPI0031717C7D